MDAKHPITALPTVGTEKRNKYSIGPVRTASSIPQTARDPSGGLLADALTQFNQQAEIHIEHCLTGNVPAAKRRKKYRDLEERIRKAITNYGTVGLSLYCRSLSKLV